MKTFKKITFLFLFTSLVVACSTNEDEDASGCETCNYTIVNGETAGNIPQNIQGEFDLVLDISVNGYAKAAGTKGKFTIAEKQLTIEIEGEPCLVLKNPIVEANGVEYSFKDTCRDTIFYAISQNATGNLNEVNVVTLEGLFYGQFKK